MATITKSVATNELIQVFPTFTGKTPKALISFLKSPKLHESVRAWRWKKVSPKEITSLGTTKQIQIFSNLFSDQIPKVLLLHIFSFFNLSKLPIFARVCKLWNNILFEHIKESSFFIEKWPALISHKEIKKDFLFETAKEVRFTTFAIKEGYVDHEYSIHNTKEAEFLIHVINRKTLMQRKFEIKIEAFVIKRYKNLVIIASKNGEIEVWDLNTDKCRYTLSMEKKILRRLAFNDNFLVCGSSEVELSTEKNEDGEYNKFSEIYVMNLKDGKDKRVIKIKNGISSFKLIKNHLYCHRIGQSTLIYSDLVYDRSKQGINLRKDLNPREGIYPGMFYAYNDSYLATESLGEIEGSYIERDIQCDKANQEEDFEPVETLASNQFFKRIPEKRVVLRNLFTDQIVRISKQHKDSICLLKFLNNAVNNFLISGSLDGTVTCWDYRKKISLNMKHENCIHLAICKKTDMLATISLSQIQVWDLNNKKGLFTVDNPFNSDERNGSWKVKISGKELFVFSRKKEMKKWSIA